MQQLDTEQFHCSGACAMAGSFILDNKHHVTEVQLPAVRCGRVPYTFVVCGRPKQLHFGITAFLVSKLEVGVRSEI